MPKPQPKLRTQRLYNFGAFVLGASAFASLSCSTFAYPRGHGPADDPNGQGGISQAEQDLEDPTGTGGANCSLNAATKVLTFTFDPAAGISVIFSKDNTGVLSFNGFPCPGVSATNVTKLVIVGSTADDTAIIDFLPNGVFLPGSASAPGITVDLGTGSNSLTIRGTSGADTITAGASGVSINNPSVKSMTIANVDNLTFTLAGGTDTFSGAGSTATGAAFPTALSIFGGDGNDSLRGGNGDDSIDGGNDSDTFLMGTAADGADTITGGTGLASTSAAEADTVDYSLRTTAVSVTADGTTLCGALVTSTLGDEGDLIGSDIEVIKGGAGDDTLTAGTSAVSIFGNAGNDTITGSPAKDTLNGGDGNDTFHMGNASSGGDVVVGGNGIDTIDFSGRSNPVTINIDATLTSGESGEKVSIAIDVENATGGQGGNVITGSAADNVLIGGASDDTISGLAGNDTIIGLAGNDTLSGGDGDDTFDEGALTVDSTNATASSGANGHDHIDGGNGSDTVDYSSRTNSVRIDLGGVLTSGELVSATLGDEGDVILTNVENANGGSGDDTINGNNFPNTLEGNDGNDTIASLGGDDIVDGGTGADVIDCGTGQGDINLDADADPGASQDPPAPTYTNCEL